MKANTYAYRSDEYKKLEEANKPRLERHRAILSEIIAADPAATCPEWWGEYYEAQQQFRGKPLADFRTWDINNQIESLGN